MLCNIIFIRATDHNDSPAVAITTYIGSQSVVHDVTGRLEGWR
jgi:hypothetical protein